MATTEAAHRRILTELANPEQQAIVAAPLEGNHLVLAGPRFRQDAGDRSSRGLATARKHGASCCDHGARLQPLGRE